jgi:hypothetical protein
LSLVAVAVVMLETVMALAVAVVVALEHQQELLVRIVQLNQIFLHF